MNAHLKEETKESIEYYKVAALREKTSERRTKNTLRAGWNKQDLYLAMH